MTATDIRILIADDHPVLRAGLRRVLDDEPGIAVVGEAVDGETSIRLALSLQPEQMWNTLNRFGFGQVTTSGFPGESAGLLSHYSHWRPVGIFTMSHGYGLSVTPLQLAHAYATLAAFGTSARINLLRPA